MERNQAYYNAVNQSFDQLLQDAQAQAQHNAAANQRAVRVPGGARGADSLPAPLGPALTADPMVAGTYKFLKDSFDATAKAHGRRAVLAEITPGMWCDADVIMMKARIAELESENAALRGAAVEPPSAAPISVTFPANALRHSR